MIDLVGVYMTLLLNSIRAVTEMGRFLLGLSGAGST